MLPHVLRSPRRLAADAQRLSVSTLRATSPVDHEREANGASRNESDHDVNAALPADTEAGCLYAGYVSHHRYAPREHKLRYRVFSLFADIDKIAALAAQSRFFSHNRFNLYGFYDRDHGDGSPRPLREQINQLLALAGINLQGGCVRLSCMPRVLGYVFDPLSVYYCYAEDGTLAALVYEVSNTFKQRHTYVIPVAANPPLSQNALDAAHVRAQRATGPSIRRPRIIEQHCPKQFHVSPFLDRDMHYRFRLTPPTECLSLSIRVSRKGRTMLDAAYTAARLALNDASLLKLFGSHPLLTLKVVVGIHWEALQLWLKGAGYRPCPPAGPDVTIVGTDGKINTIFRAQIANNDLFKDSTPDATGATSSSHSSSQVS